MSLKISVVINSLNEEKNIKQAIKSVSWADEIIVCDMQSDDQTAKIAKDLGAKVILHKRTGYVEPARNFAISKTGGDWILILDADEELTLDLVSRLKEMVNKEVEASFVEIPRKNIIFNKWMKASFWWPDYQIRFFKKGTVVWDDQIHSKPQTKGVGLTLPAEEKWAIIHHNYQTIHQFVDRLNRYSEIEAKILESKGYKFNWKDLIQKPLNEFLSRFFANRGFEDGLHGLSLSLLQAFSFLVVYLRIWEMEKFKLEEISIKEIKEVTRQSESEIEYWFKYINLSKNPFKRFFQKVKDKV